MGKNVENPWLVIDQEPAGPVFRYGDGGFLELDPTEQADLRSHCGSQAAFDAWWAARPTAEANFYAGHSTSWKAKQRANVLLLT